MNKRAAVIAGVMMWVADNRLYISKESDGITYRVKSNQIDNLIEYLKEMQRKSEGEESVVLNIGPFVELIDEGRIQ